MTQIELVTGILGLLEEHKFSLNQRQMNAVIEGADIIHDALNNAHKRATPGSGLQAWLESDETGLSSRYMASVLAPLAGITLHIRSDGNNHPHDPGDFGRCVGLLDAVPELRPHILALANGHGEVWAKLAPLWDVLETMYREELPSGTAPKLYKRIRAIVEGMEDAERS